MNNKFYELRVPTKLRGGKFRDKWVVCTYYSCGEPFGYLHNDTKLYEYWIVADSLTSGIFETRLDALMEMKSYYYDHRELFPYGEEFTKEFAAGGSYVENTDVIESQTMTFK